jgi:transposase
VAMGRRNYLFAGSDFSGERAAALYSLIGSTKLSGLDPQLYLRAVLDRIAEHPVSRITTAALEPHTKSDLYIQGRLIDTDM